MGRKKLYGYFKQQTGWIAYKKSWTWRQKRKLKKETESLLNTSQNNPVRTNYIKTKIDDTQQSDNCRLWGERNEAVNIIICKCNDSAQKENKTKHEWVGKVICRELCKRLKFDNTAKWYMPKPE